MRRAVVAVALVAGCNSSPAPEPQGAGDRVQELYARLNDDPDLLHADYTPAVNELIRVGRPAIPRALDLILAADRDTRMRAQRVLEGVTLHEYGFNQGEGWKRPDGEAEWRQFWARLGGLTYDAPPDARAASVSLWRA